MKTKRQKQIFPSCFIRKAEIDKLIYEKSIFQTNSKVRDIKYLCYEKIDINRQVYYKPLVIHFDLSQEK